MDALVREINIMIAEARETEQRAPHTPDNPRRRMAMAQLLLCRDISLYLLANDDWEQGFMTKLGMMLAEDYETYYASREEGDHRNASIAIARVRGLVKFLNRLNNHQRQKELAEAEKIFSGLPEMA